MHANWNIQYERYLRNDVIRRDLYVSCSHNDIISEGAKSLKVDGFLQKIADNYMKTYSQFLQVQIMDPKLEYCRSLDFIGQNEKFSKNQHKT